MKTLGERIRFLRGKESQKDFARRLGLSKGSIGGYERNENSPSAEVVIKICTMDNISSEWLLFGKEPIKPSTPLNSVPITEEEISELTGWNKVLHKMESRDREPKELSCQAKNESLMAELVAVTSLRVKAEEKLTCVTDTLVKTQRELIDAQIENQQLLHKLLTMLQTREGRGATSDAPESAPATPATPLTDHAND